MCLRILNLLSYGFAYRGNYPPINTYGLSVTVVIGLMAATWLLLRWFLVSWGDQASFGDMYGVTNTLFSGLAFALLVLTLLMQKEELSLQRRELQETREELARSAAAQEKSEKALCSNQPALFYRQRKSSDRYLV